MLRAHVGIFRQPGHDKRLNDGFIVPIHRVNQRQGFLFHI